MSARTPLTNPRKHWILAGLHWVIENSNNPHIKILYMEGKTMVPLGYAKPEEVQISQFSSDNGATLVIGSYNQAPVVTLNISPGAIKNYVEGENSLSFMTRFNGVVHTIDIPYDYIFMVFCGSESDRLHQVVPVSTDAIPREDRGLAPSHETTPLAAVPTSSTPEATRTDTGTDPSAIRVGRPTLTRVK